MVNKNNLILAGLTGVSAAAVAVLSIGGYFLHKKALRHRIYELTRRQAMNLAFLELAGGCVPKDSDDFEDYYEDEDYYENEDEYDYSDEFFDNLDTSYKFGSIPIDENMGDLER